MEHRWGQRQSTDVMVRFVNLPATIGMGRLLNISVTGAYMETPLRLRRLSLVYLEPAAPSSSLRRFRRIAASVVRLDETGVGLEWSDVDARSTPVFARFANLPAALIDDPCLPLQQTIAVPPGAMPIIDNWQYYRLDFID